MDKETLGIGNSNAKKDAWAEYMIYDYKHTHKVDECPDIRHRTIDEEYHLFIGTSHFKIGLSELPSWYAHRNDAKHLWNAGITQ